MVVRAICSQFNWSKERLFFCHLERAQRVEGPLSQQDHKSGCAAQQEIRDCWRAKGSLDSSLRSSLRMTKQKIRSSTHGASRNSQARALAFSTFSITTIAIHSLLRFR